ncbi:MAG: efflux transporter periplasmic adaptor subunit, partial [Betaproteobacteria bacterium]|nr:efflux transporter periplasmic adaptor subunit [Betaproteobacteria bacterium]
AIDPATRTGRVEVVLNPVPKGARPGQFCRVVLATGSREQLVVPLAALQRDVKGEFVFVYQPSGGTVQRTSVASGLRLADRVEIRDGLERGAQVVVKGFLGLSAGQRVKPVAPRPARDS